MRSSRFLLVTTMSSAFWLAACGTSTNAPLAVPECTACHGDGTRAGTALQQAAPPLDAHGRSARTEVTVGAHQPHLDAGVACSTCHVVPPSGDRTHFRLPTATVTFSGNVVGAQGATVAPWNRTAPTCANYCHGGSGLGGSLLNPSWVQTTALDCGSCHWNQQSALTATGLHQLHVNDLPVASRLDCGACHGDGYSKTGVTGGATATHVDGTVQLLPGRRLADRALHQRADLLRELPHGPGLQVLAVGAGPGSSGITR